MVFRLLCVKSSNFFGGLFTLLLLIFYHLYSFSLETFYSTELFSLLPLLDFTSLFLSSNKSHALNLHKVSKLLMREKFKAFVMFSTEKLLPS